MSRASSLLQYIIVVLSRKFRTEHQEYKSRYYGDHITIYINVVH